MTAQRNPRDLQRAFAARERAASAFLSLGDRLQRNEPETSPGEPGSDEDAQALFRVIEAEIIPRLMLAHAAPEEEPPAPPSVNDPAVTLDDRTRLLEAVAFGPPADSRRLVDEIRGRGVPLETIFLDLLAFVARRLGELWESDHLDFTTVTIGLCRLHEILREQSLWPEGHATDLDSDAPRILLATAGGDQHVFGVVMVAEFFRKAGWRVSTEPGASDGELVELLGEQPFDLLGLSAACTTLVGVMRGEIEKFRRASCNRDLRVLVGGRLFVDSPELVREVGADAAAFDAPSAPDAGKSLLARSEVRC